MRREDKAERAELFGGILDGHVEDVTGYPEVLDKEIPGAAFGHAGHRARYERTSRKSQAGHVVYALARLAAA